MTKSVLRSIGTSLSETCAFVVLSVDGFPLIIIILFVLSILVLNICLLEYHYVEGYINVGAYIIPQVMSNLSADASHVFGLFPWVNPLS